MIDYETLWQAADVGPTPHAITLEPWIISLCGSEFIHCSAARVGLFELIQTLAALLHGEIRAVCANPMLGSAIATFVMQSCQAG